MNLLSKYSIAGLILASTSVFSAEPAMGWYAGLFGGLSYAPSISSTSTIATPYFSVAVDNKLSYRVGGNAGIQLGYRCNKFRYEGEFLYNINKFNKFTINGTNIVTLISPLFSFKGNTSIYAGFFNVYYEFYDEDYAATKFVPYVGLGLGYAHVTNKLNFYYNNVNTFGFSESSNAPIGQAILGVNYFFNDDISLGTDLRYASTNKLSSLDARATVASWNIVFNYSFDRPY